MDILDILFACYLVCISLFLIGIAIYIETGNIMWFTKKKVYLLDKRGNIMVSREISPGFAYFDSEFERGNVYLFKDGTTQGYGHITHWAYDFNDLPRKDN